MPPRVGILGSRDFPQMAVAAHVQCTAGNGGRTLNRTFELPFAHDLAAAAVGADFHHLARAVLADAIQAIADQRGRAPKFSLQPHSPGDLAIGRVRARQHAGPIDQ